MIEMGQHLVRETWDDCPHMVGDTTEGGIFLIQLGEMDDLMVVVTVIGVDGDLGMDVISY